MMRACLLTIATFFCLFGNACAQVLQPLSDTALSEVSGADGVSFAMHLALNDPTLPNPVTDSRIAMGFNVDGRTTWLVIKNLRGSIDMAGVNLCVNKHPDGGDYLALTLPSLVKYTNFGFESLSAQADPLGPISDSIGRFSINGNLSMRGQLRVWAH